MSHKFIFACLVVATSLSACVTPSQQAAEQQKAAQEKMAAALARCGDLIKDPRLDPIRGRIIASDGTATLAMKSNTSFVSEADLGPLAVLQSLQVECRQGILQAGPPELPVHIAAWARGDERILALYKREITIGQYVEGTDRSIKQFMTEAVAYRQAQHERSLQSQAIQQQIALQQQQSRALALQQVEAGMRLFQPPQQPRLTTNCTTTTFGNQLQTRCF